MKEIEKKFLVSQLPEHLQNYKKVEIVQGYLNRGSEPVLRIRKYGKDYFLTYKSATDEEKQRKINICTEYELPITSEAFNHLKTKIDGKIISKTRYYVPFCNQTLEIDIFKDWLEGLVIAEIEFETEDEARKFNKPSWLGKEVTKDRRYRNSYMSSGNVDVQELL